MAIVNNKEQNYLVFRHFGVHHANWYDVEIPVPINVFNFMSGRLGISDPSDLKNILNQYCTQVAFPSQSIMSTPFYPGGEAIEVPYQRVYQPITTTFYVSGGSGLTYRIFQEWVNYIFNPNSRVFSYYNEYTSTVKITAHGGVLWGGSQNNTNTVYLYEAWPSEIGGMQLDGTNGSTPTTFTISWKYRYITTAPNNLTEISKRTNIVNNVQKTVINSNNVTNNKVVTPVVQSAHLRVDNSIGYWDDTGEFVPISNEATMEVNDELFVKIRQSKSSQAHVNLNNKDNKELSKIELTEKTPQTREDLKTVGDTSELEDPLKDQVIEWANKNVIGSTETTNWDQAKNLWNMYNGSDEVLE